MSDPVLTSSALTPVGIESLFQPLIARVLGFVIEDDPAGAFSAVRIGWPVEGHPGWDIDEDVCVIRATLDDEPFARVRDDFLEEDASPSGDLVKRMGFTQVWRMHFTLYGANCADHARLILSAVTLDWVHDVLAASSIYRIPAAARPVYLPENFQGQWWKRADLELQFNESVEESLTVSSATGVDVTVTTDELTEQFPIGTV